MTKRKKNLFLLDEIVKIKHVGKKQCYDLSIPKNHNFFANGILVHNSGSLEEIADMVFLLHWPYYYERDINTMNEYIINVAKNRDGRTALKKVLFYPEYSKFKEVNNDNTEND